MIAMPWSAEIKMCLVMSVFYKTDGKLTEFVGLVIVFSPLSKPQNHDKLLSQTVVE